MSKRLFKKFAIRNPKDLVNFLKMWKTLLEAFKVFLFRQAPLYLAGCTKTREKLVEYVCWIFYVLCPKVDLQTSSFFAS